MEHSTASPRAHPLLSVAGILSGRVPADEGALRVEVFTDPLSAWCWGSEPVWTRVSETYGGLISVTYRMVGLLQSLSELVEAQAAGAMPAQMAMHWEEVAHHTRMPLDSEVWTHAPPESSWPACAFYEAAALLDDSAAERVLRRLRETVLCEAQDLSDHAVLDRLVDALGLERAPLEAALESGAAGAAFEADMSRAAEVGSVTCPSYAIAGPAATVELRGSQSFESHTEARARALGRPPPVIIDPSTARDRAAYGRTLVDARGSLAAAELAALLGVEVTDARDLLDRLAAAGHVERIPVGRLAIYRAA